MCVYVCVFGHAGGGGGGGGMTFGGGGSNFLGGGRGTPSIPSPAEKTLQYQRQN